MPTPCNIRYKQLLQLEAEFASLKVSGDSARLKEVAAQIVDLRREFGGRHVECERIVYGEKAQ
jgi:hypothetical protein